MCTFCVRFLRWFLRWSGQAQEGEVLPFFLLSQKINKHCARKAHAGPDSSFPKTMKGDSHREHDTRHCEIECHCCSRSYRVVVDTQVLDEGRATVMVSLLLTSSIWEAISFVVALQVHQLSGAMLCVRKSTWAAVSGRARDPGLVCSTTTRTTYQRSKFGHGTLYALHVSDIKSSQYTQTSFKQVFVDMDREERREKKILWTQKRVNCCGLRGHHIDRFWCFGKFDKFEVVERTSDCEADELYNPREIYPGFGEERKTHSHHYVHSTR